MKSVAVYQRRADAQSPDNAYDSRLLTKLVRNYRSHPDILKLPNDMFYTGELEVKHILNLADNIGFIHYLLKQIQK